MPGFFSPVSDPAALTGAPPGQPDQLAPWTSRAASHGRPTRGPWCGYRAPAAVVRGPWTVDRVCVCVDRSPRVCDHVPRITNTDPLALVRDPGAGGHGPCRPSRGPRRPGPAAHPTHPGPQKTGRVAGVAGLGPVLHGMFHVKQFWALVIKGPLCVTSQPVSKFAQI